MPLGRCFLTIILYFSSCLTAGNDDRLGKQAQYVKVLLDDRNASEQASWTLNTQNPCVVMMVDGVEKKQIPVAATTVSISYSDGLFKVNDIPVTSPKLIIKACKGGITFDGNNYSGAFLFLKHAEKVYVITILNLEHYICSVLHTESWPGWPLEVNKALAIACRTYAVYMMTRANRSGKPYHIKNTNSHQTYRGARENQLLQEAVRQTEGQILTYEGAPILAMFDACCGGVVPANIDDFDFSNTPYLARPYGCTACKRSKIYQWKAELSLSDLSASFKDYCTPCVSVKDIRVTKKDKAGMVKEVMIRLSNNKREYVTGKKIYSLFKSIKSCCFSIKRTGNKFLFSGYGYGHNMGLCQWGVRAMVKDGWDYASILHYYYPGTMLSRMRVSSIKKKNEEETHVQL